MMVFACRFSGVSVCGGASCASSRAACAAAYHARFTQIDPMPVTQDFGQCEGAGDQIKPAHAQKRLVGLMDFHEPQTPASRHMARKNPPHPTSLNIGVSFTSGWAFFLIAHLSGQHKRRQAKEIAHHHGGPVQVTAGQIRQAHGKRNTATRKEAET